MSPSLQMDSEIDTILYDNESFKDDDSLDKWILLIEDFYSVRSANKTLLEDLRKRGHQIEVKSINESDDSIAKLDNSDTEIIHRTTIEIDEILTLTTNGQNKDDAENKVLAQLIGFLQNVLNLTKRFKALYSPNKSAVQIIDSLVTIGTNGLVKISVNKIYDWEWSTTIELQNIAIFIGIATEIRASKYSASVKFVDYLKRFCRTEVFATTEYELRVPLDQMQFESQKIIPAKKKLNALNNSLNRFKKYSQTETRDNASSYNNFVSPQVEDLIKLNELYNSVDSHNQSNMKIIQNLNAKGRPAIQICFTQVKLSDFMENIENYYVTTNVEISFRMNGSWRTKRAITFEASTEEILNRKPDAMGKTVIFLKNLDGLIQKAKPKFTSYKCPVKMLYALKIENPRFLYVSVSSSKSCSTTLIQIGPIASFIDENAQKEVCKHNASARAIEFLSQLCQTEETTLISDINQCECNESSKSMESNHPMLNRFNYSNKAQKKFIFKSESQNTLPNYDDEIEPENQPLLAKMIQLIADYNTVKDRLPNPYMVYKVVNEFNAINEMGIALSPVEVCADESFKVEVNIADILLYVIHDKNEHCCVHDAYKKAVRFLRNLSNLHANYKYAAQHSHPNIEASDFIDHIIYRNHELLTVTSLRNNENGTFTTTICIATARFIDIGATFEESRQRAAEKAVCFLKKLDEVLTKDCESDAISQTSSGTNLQRPPSSTSIRSQSSSSRGSNTFYYMSAALDVPEPRQTSHKSYDKNENGNMPLAARTDPKTAYARLPHIIRLIGKFDSVKANFSHAVEIVEELKKQGEKIRISLKSASNSIHNKLMTFNIDIEHLAKFSASAEELAQCKEKALTTTLDYFHSLVQLVNDFKSLLQIGLSPLDTMQQLALQCSEIVKVTSNATLINGQSHAIIEILHLVTFEESSQDASAAEELAAEMAVKYLSKLAQVID